MSDIKVGDYCRTKDGIHKITEIKEDTLDTWAMKYYRYDNNMGDFESEILKHSPNIIDLIEKRRLCEWI